MWRDEVSPCASFRTRAEQATRTPQYILRPSAIKGFDGTYIELKPEDRRYRRKDCQVGRADLGPQDRSMEFANATDREPHEGSPHTQVYEVMESGVRVSRDETRAEYAMSCNAFSRY